MNLDHLEVFTFRVPLHEPHADGTLKWDATTVVVVELHAQGHIGIGWTYGPRACAAVIEDDLAPVLSRSDLDDVVPVWRAMVASVRNSGRPGVCSMSISAADIALWDLKARSLGMSLARLFSGERAAAPVYWSGGFTSYSESELKSEFASWVGQRGMRRAKMKIGAAAGAHLRDDIARIDRVREAIGSGCDLMIDANGAYSRKEALEVGRAAADRDVVWFEEPVSSDDRPSLAWLRDRLELEVAAGEYGYDARYLAEMAAVVDVLQVDATRCGGYTEWFRAAAVAASLGLDVSGHTAQSLHVHVAGATPNLRHIEYFADHHYVDRLLFNGVPEPTGDELHPDVTNAGHGMTLKHQDADDFLISHASLAGVS